MHRAQLKILLNFSLHRICSNWIACKKYCSIVCYLSPWCESQSPCDYFLINHWRVNEITILRARRVITHACMMFHEKAFLEKGHMVSEKIITGVCGRRALELSRCSFQLAYFNGGNYYNHLCDITASIFIDIFIWIFVCVSICHLYNVYHMWTIVIETR